MHHLPADLLPKSKALSSCIVPLRNNAAIYASQPSLASAQCARGCSPGALRHRKSYSPRATVKRGYVRNISYLTSLLPKGAPGAAYLGS